MCHPSGAKVDDLCHPKVRDLGRHVRGQEDVVGREVAVDDDGVVGMEIVEPQGDVVNDGIADLGRKQAVLLDSVREGKGHELQYQYRHIRPLLYVKTQKLDDTWMP